MNSKKHPVVKARVEPGETLAISVNGKLLPREFDVFELASADVSERKKIIAHMEKQGIENWKDQRHLFDLAKKLFEKEKKKEERTQLKEAFTEFTDYLEMADRFIKKQPLFYTRQRLWWIWNHETKSWGLGDETDLLNQMNEKVKGLTLFKTKQKTEVLNSLKMRGRLNTPKEADKNWIQLKDTIYDIKTGASFKSTPAYFVTNPIPWKLGETEDTPTIDKLFHEWVDKNKVPLLYEIIAYSMLPNYPLHRVFCLNGGGRNGKGSYLQILTTFIGKDNICSTDFDTLTTRPFESAKLYKKLVCTMGEINANIFKRTNLFKKLTGSDMIGFEFKGKDGFDDYNYAKLLIATNKLPETTDKTVGFFSRWQIVDYPNTFKEKSGLLDCIPPEEYNNLARKSIRILKEILEKNEFTGEGTIEERATRYEERASPIKEFLETCCDIETDDETPFWEVYEEYSAYLDERGFRKASKRELSHLLKSRGYTTDKMNYNKPDGTPSSMVMVSGLLLHYSYTKKGIHIQQNLEEF